MLTGAQWNVDTFCHWGLEVNDFKTLRVPKCRLKIAPNAAAVRG